MAGPLDFIWAPSRHINGSPPLPVGVSQAVSIFMWVHEVWRWRGDIAEIRASSGRTYAYLSGFALSRTGVGQSFPIQWLAQVAFIIETQLRTQKQLEKVRKVWVDLAATAFFVESLPLNAIQPFEEKHRVWRPITSLLFDPVTERNFEIFFQLLKARVYRTFLLTLRFIYETYILSHYCLLLQEALACGEASRTYAVQKMFLNWGSILEHLAENKEYLKDRLLRMRMNADEYFGVDVSDFMRACDVALETAEVASRALESKPVSAFVDGVSYLLESAKKTVLSGVQLALNDTVGVVDPRLLQQLAPKPLFGDCPEGETDCEMVRGYEPPKVPRIAGPNRRRIKGGSRALVVVP